MATQTHQLNIKAKLDTSEVRAELDRLNQNRGARAEAGGAQGQGATSRTTQLLTKLDSTLNRLNATLQKLSGDSSKYRSSQSRTTGPIYAPPGWDRDSIQKRFMASKRDYLEKQTRKYFVDTLTRNPVDLDWFNQFLKQPVFKPGQKGWWQRPDAENWYSIIRSGRSIEDIYNDLAKKHHRENEISFDTWKENQLAHAKSVIDAREQRLAKRNFSNKNSYFRHMRIGWGLNMLGQGIASTADLMNGSEYDQRRMQGIGNIVSTTGMAFMINPVIGALAAVGTSLFEFGKALKDAEMQVKEFSQKRQAAVTSAEHGLKTSIAETGILYSPEHEGLVERARKDLQLDIGKRADAYRELIDIQGKPYTEENAKAIEDQQKYINSLDKSISVNERIIEISNKRKEALEAEVQSGQRLAQAEIEFSKSLEEAEYKRRRDWSDYNTSNIQANREALRNYRQQLTGARASQMMAVFNTGIESQLGQIRTNTFNGNKDPAYWYKLAREQRSYIGQFQQLALGTGDLQKMAEYMRQAGEASQKFSGFMQMAQALKIMQIGQPVNRVDLQSLTSLAGRGGWMGEQYRQPEYMSTLDKMYDTLKSIDDNTRAAEKSVWQ